MLAAVQGALLHHNVCPGRSYPASRQVTDTLERVRLRTSEFLNAPGDGLVAFGPNATTLVNLVASTMASGLSQG